MHKYESTITSSPPTKVDARECLSHWCRMIMIDNLHACTTQCTFNTAVVVMAFLASYLIRFVRVRLSLWHIFRAVHHTMKVLLLISKKKRKRDLLHKIHSHEMLNWYTPFLPLDQGKNANIEAYFFAVGHQKALTLSQNSVNRSSKWQRILTSMMETVL